MKTLGNRRGLTLIELVVTLAIAGVVMAAAATILVSGVRTYNLNLKSTQSQQSLRTAMMRITKEVRGAGKVEAAGGTLTLDGNAFTVSGDMLRYKGNGYADNIKAIRAELKDGNTVVEIVLTASDNNTLTTQINIVGRD